LNQEGVERIGNYKGKKVKSCRWSNVVVNKILTSKKVLGFNDNVDPPVKMYPKVIDEKVYYAARAKMEARKTHKYYGQNGGGRNLFAGVIYCQECGQRMCMHHIPTYARKSENYVSRGGVGARGGKAIHSYLWCGGYVNGSCSSKQIRYEYTEESFVAAVSCSVHTLTLADTKKTSPEGNDMEMLKGQLVEARALLGKYTAINTEVPTKAGAIMIQKQEQEEERLTAEIENATTVEIGSTPLNEAKKELMALMYRDWSAEDTRMKARELIRSLVERITVDIPHQSYLIKWRVREKPTAVELVKRGYKLTGYKIDGTFYPSMGRDWQKCTSDIARYAKDAEAYTPVPA
jgi:hypothetical protein